MTDKSESKAGRAVRRGCIVVISSCLAALLVVLAWIWASHTFNLCGLGSPDGCQNIYRISGSISRSSHLAISPDGRWLALTTERRLMILDTNTGRTVASTDVGSNPYPEDVAISRDGKYAATVLNNNRVVLLSAEDGQVYFVESESPSLGGFHGAPFFTADSQYLLTSMFIDHDRGYSIIQYDIRNQKSGTLFEAAHLVALSPDGSRLAMETEAGVEIWSIAGAPHQVTVIPVSTWDWAMTAAFYPDGNSIILAYYPADQGGRESVSQWIDLQTGETLYSDAGGVTELTFSPDGKYLTSHGCRTSIIGVLSPGTFSELYYYRLDFVSPFETNLLSALSGVSGCTTNAVFAPDSETLYYGDSGKIGRLAIPGPVGLLLFERMTPAP